ncbi:MAG: phosphatase PAP2 family protein [Gemmatimonadetes bacterium]|nr:phosphatase PAP2 family protein [Gemmatimonadota bacterium]
MRHTRRTLRGRRGAACSSLALLLLMGVTASPIQAQDRPFPYELKSRDLLMLPLGLGMTVWGESLLDGTDPIPPAEVASLQREDVNWFDRRATENWSLTWDDRSDGFRAIVVWGGLALTAVEGANQLFRGEASNTAALAVMGVEMTLFTMGATYMTKGLAGRKRPYMFNTDLSLEDRIVMGASDDGNASHSFFSGHTSAAFALATFSSKVFTDIHGRSNWSHLVWGSTLTFAALTGYARVKAGVHYPTDVIAGAIVGSAIGYLVPTLHRKGREGRLGLVVTPTQMGLRLRF